MDNLVQRLRNSDDLNDQQITFACVEAADEIERLREWDRKRQEDIMTLGKEIAGLRAELEAERNSQISAVNGMLAAEQREATTIERCAQAADNMAYIEACADDTLAGTARAAPYRKVATAIRALKDKP